MAVKYLVLKFISRRQQQLIGELQSKVLYVPLQTFTKLVHKLTNDLEIKRSERSRTIRKQSNNETNITIDYTSISRKPTTT